LALAGAIEAVNVGLVVYSGAVFVSIIARSFHDGLLTRFGNDESSTPGSGGGIWPPRPTKWTFGKNHSSLQWENRMKKRGWTISEINDAIQNGKAAHAINLIPPNNPATRYTLESGRYVVLDDVTNELMQISGKGFLFE
jgi:hypothetical protein